ncbi:unnamed protein product [Ambrosiozyma monospora]|uniref:Unnamed protein product n=1 Tax=Ambrosiozyma monospora TaxID=43982 RepID=A0ACB5U9P9_AMBMO|nr:unnamed protein product [Ambrosiozyma monospora]
METLTHFKQLQQFSISQATLSNWTVKEAELRDEFDNNPNLEAYKRKPVLKYPKVTKAVEKYIEEASNKGQLITDQMIKDVFVKYMKQYGYDDQHFNLSGGMLHSFKKRNLISRGRKTDTHHLPLHSGSSGGSSSHGNSPVTGALSIQQLNGQAPVPVPGPSPSGAIPSMVVSPSSVGMSYHTNNTNDRNTSSPLVNGAANTANTTNSNNTASGVNMNSNNNNNISNKPLNNNTNKITSPSTTTSTPENRALSNLTGAVPMQQSPSNSMSTSGPGSGDKDLDFNFDDIFSATDVVVKLLPMVVLLKISKCMGINNNLTIC